MDLSKLNTSEKIIAGSGLVLFISSFLPWFGKGPYDGNGWDVGFLWGGLPALLGLLSAAIVLGTKFADLKLPELPATTGQMMLGAGAIAAVLVLVKMVFGYEACAGFEGFGKTCIDLDRKIGLILATISALGLAYGGFLSFQAEKSST